jgi:BMFP domain-containing protein YqiC
MNRETRGGRAKMDKSHVLNDLQQKIASMLAASPAADLQKNMKALLMQQFARLELVTQEEFDLQREVLARTREKLEALEARVAQIEARR